MPKLKKQNKHLQKIYDLKIQRQSQPLIPMDTDIISENDSIIDVSNSSDIQDPNNELRILNAKNDQLIFQNSELQDQNLDLKNQANVLDSNISELNRNIMLLNAKIDQLTLQNNELQDQNFDLKNQVNELDSCISVLKNKNVTLNPIDTNIICENVNVIDISESSDIEKFKDLTNTHKIQFEKKRSELIDKIKSLPLDEIVAACHLFKTMTYSNGKCAGKIFSLYIVNKAKAFVEEGLYKQNFSVSAIQDTVRRLEKVNKKLERGNEIKGSHVHSLTMK